MSLLARYPPMLLEERPFDLNEPGWIYEIKFDGYRLRAEFGTGKCELRTRNGASATKWFPEVVKSLAAMPGGPHVVDGEVCVLDELGRSDFDKLHDRARRRRWYEGCDVVTFCAFDMLVLKGLDFTQRPLIARKAALKRLLKPPLPHVLYVSHFEDHGQALFDQAVVPLKLEGLIAKRAKSVYQPGVRSSDWVKVKRRGAVPPERFKRGER